MRHEPEGRQPVFLVPWPTTVLLGALVAAYLVQGVLGQTEDVALRYGFAPGDLGRGLFSTLITYQFLHGNLAHLVMNALFALALGPPVARLLGLGPVGGASFFLFYLVCGAAAALGFGLVHPGPEGGFLIGASGAISGLFGAATRLLGRPGLAPLNDRRMLSMAAVITAVNIVVGLIGLMPGSGPGPVAIAWEAHVAGYIVGLLLIGPWSRATWRLTSRLDSGSGLRHAVSPRPDHQEPKMLVAQILKHKGDAVFTVAPEMSVAEAAHLLHSRQVGAVVVIGPDSKVVGILSERDVVRLMVQQGAGGLEAPVSSCMTADVLFAKPTETVDSLLSRMTDRRIRHLPVCVSDRLVGIVSIGDLVKWKIAETEEAAEELKAYISQG